MTDFVSSPPARPADRGSGARPDLESLGPVARAWVAAIAAQEFDSLAEVLSPAVAFRALVPRGLREGDTSDAAIAWVRRWFGDADVVDVLAASGGDVSDRIHFGYRLLIHEPEGWSVVEQQVYATLVDGRAEKVDLLCSGFRPVDAPDGATADEGGSRPSRAAGDVRLDALGADCSSLVPRIAQSMAGLPAGGVLDILTDDPTASPTLAAWTRLTGHELVGSAPDAGAGTHWLVRKKES